MRERKKEGKGKEGNRGEARRKRIKKKNGRNAK
jgi:hypothetical protein